MPLSIAAWPVLWLVASAAPSTAPAGVEHAAHARIVANETWEIRQGRFYRNGQWVFLKTGKLLRAFERSDTAMKTIAEIEVMSERLHYNHFSLNIYPEVFDADADGQIDKNRLDAYHNIGLILDGCFERGVFCSLSFETYNVGGGGTPNALFERHPDAVAINALGEPAHDVEYFENGKRIPSIFSREYLDWSRGFLRNFLRGLGPERVSRLLYVETTVEPQYLGRCNYRDHDDRRAFLDFNPAAAEAFERWKMKLLVNDPGRSLSWPKTQHERDQMLGHHDFNRFRAQSLAEWVNGDIEAIRSVAPDVYIAVDFNGRGDDTNGLRLGDNEIFLNTLRGVNVIQVAPHTPEPWGPLAWDEANRINRQAKKQWAISEHMTATGDWAVDDAEMTRILDNTLERGTRWGWEFVNAGNQHERDSFNLYDSEWKSPVLDVIEGPHWEEWRTKIGAPPFERRRRDVAGTSSALQR